jgi:hypothetical protein
MAKLNIFGLLEIDLKKMIELAQEFLAADKDARNAIKGFIDETEKAYTAITKSITPLYELLYDDTNFTGKFPAQYSWFMDKLYGSNTSKVRAQCTVVQEELTKVEDNVKKNFSVRRSSEIIQTLSKLWLLRDYTVSDTLDSINQEFDLQLRQVSSLLEHGNPQQARKQLQLFISETRTSINQIQRLLNELQQIRMRL